MLTRQFRLASFQGSFQARMWRLTRPSFVRGLTV
jgi:hypothetical protein